MAVLPKRKRRRRLPKSFAAVASSGRINLGFASASIVSFVGLTTLLIYGSFGILFILNRSTGVLGPTEALSLANAYLWDLLWTSTVLVVGAIFIAWISSRSVSNDVDEVAQSVRLMASSQQATAPIPIRTLDELGELLRRFEALRLHFLETLAIHSEARQRAEETDQNNTEFLTAIRHELRTPLNSILGFADVLAKEIDGKLTEGQMENVDTIRSAGVHLMALFNDVLDLSAAELGRLSIEVERVDAAALIEDAVRELNAQVVGRPIKILSRVEPGLPPVFADRKRARQILSNLGSNALKFTKKGSITLSVSMKRDRIAIAVTDTGVGIDKGEIGRIFEEFHQAPGESPHRGAGLGLAISKRLAELQGGRLTVESKVGEGSTFTLYLDAWVKR